MYFFPGFPSPTRSQGFSFGLICRGASIEDDVVFELSTAEDEKQAKFFIFIVLFMGIELGYTGQKFRILGIIEKGEIDDKQLLRK